jgi:hypothetical protein
MVKYYTREYSELHKLFVAHLEPFFTERVRFLFGAIYLAFSQYRQIFFDNSSLIKYIHENVDEFQHKFGYHFKSGYYNSRQFVMAEGKCYTEYRGQGNSD